MEPARSLFALADFRRLWGIGLTVTVGRWLGSSRE